MVLSLSICVSIILSSRPFFIWSLCSCCMICSTTFFSAFVAVWGVTSKWFVSSFFTSKNLNVLSARLRVTFSLNWVFFYLSLSGLSTLGVITFMTGDCFLLVESFCGLELFASGILSWWLSFLARLVFSRGYVGLACSNYVGQFLSKLRADWFFLSS